MKEENSLTFLCNGSRQEKEVVSRNQNKLGLSMFAMIFME